MWGGVGGERWVRVSDRGFGVILSLYCMREKDMRDGTP